MSVMIDTEPEFGPPWSECMHPHHWHCWSGQSVEVEVGELLTALVVALKPDVVVETGTGVGFSTVFLGEGLLRNGTGMLYSQDTDGVALVEAMKRAADCGVSKCVRFRQGEQIADLFAEYGIRRCDLAFVDSDTPMEGTRGDEVQWLLDGHLSPRGVVVVHDTSPYWSTNRARLDSLTRATVLHLPTPRGLSLIRVRTGAE